MYKNTISLVYRQHGSEWFHSNNIVNYVHLQGLCSLMAVEIITIIAKLQLGASLSLFFRHNTPNTHTHHYTAEYIEV